jgi:hypothetical protein
MRTSPNDLMQGKKGRKSWIPIACLALLFVIAVVLSPTFHDTYFGVAKNESTAVASLRKIYELENAYSAGHPENGFACQLKQLQPAAGMPSLYGNPMNFLTKEWVGYKFDIVSCIPDKNGVFAQYQITAAPLRAGISGVRAFCTDQSGNVFYDSNGSASECLSARRLLD